MRLLMMTKQTAARAANKYGGNEMDTFKMQLRNITDKNELELMRGDEIAVMRDQLARIDKQRKVILDLLDSKTLPTLGRTQEISMATRGLERSRKRMGQIDKRIIAVCENGEAA
jgi:hypothetical protein